MPRGAPLPDSVREEIWTMHKGRLEVAEIAREVGLPVQTVYRVIKERKLLEGEAQETNSGPTADEVIGMIEMYERERPLAEIMAAYNVGSSVLYRILGEAGIPTHAEKQKAHRKQLLDDAMEMYERGDKLWEISQATTLSVNTIVMEVHKRDLPMRREGARKRSYVGHGVRMEK